MIPTERNDAETAAEVVFEEWICRYGPPKIIQSDRGTHFTSEVFQKVCHLAGFKHKMGAPGHAESQGQVERQNQLIRALAGNNVDKWPHAMLRVVYYTRIMDTKMRPLGCHRTRIPDGIWNRCKDSRGGVQ